MGIKKLPNSVYQKSKSKRERSNLRPNFPVAESDIEDGLDYASWLVNDRVTSSNDKIYDVHIRHTSGWDFEVDLYQPPCLITLKCDVEVEVEEYGVDVEISNMDLQVYFDSNLTKYENVDDSQTLWDNIPADVVDCLYEHLMTLKLCHMG